MDHPIQARRPNLVSIYLIMKINESIKIDTYLDLARELKKLRNLKVTVILNVVGVLGTLIKGWERRQEEPREENREHTDHSTDEIG